MLYVLSNVADVKSRDLRETLSDDGESNASCNRRVLLSSHLELASSSSS